MANGTPINWGPVPKGSPMLMHPFYLKYSNLAFSEFDGSMITAMYADILKMYYDNQSAEIVAYAVNLARVVSILTA